jgi:cytochrome c biogenesis protein CcmG, thiol:disulfide interchange protein DsbE
MSARPRTNIPLLFSGMLMSGLIVSLLAVGFLFDPFALPNEMVGKVAPNFELKDLDGNEVSLKSLRGRPVVLNFWSTWCIPCKQEHPVLVEAAKLYPEVAFLGVVYMDEAEPIRHYLRRNGSSYPHLIDPDSAVAINYGVTGVPESYFIDRRGRIMFKAAYPVNSPFLAAQLETLLGGAR